MTASPQRTGSHDRVSTQCSFFFFSFIALVCPCCDYWQHAVANTTIQRWKNGLLKR